MELHGLGRAKRSFVQELGSRCAAQRIATVVQDAPIIESRKQEALRTYEGERGCQPMLGRRGDWGGWTWCWRINFGTGTCRR